MKFLFLKGHERDWNMAVRFDSSGDSLLSLYQGALHLWRAPSWAEIEAAEKGIEGMMR